jgi:hypothetical protein
MFAACLSPNPIGRDTMQKIKLHLEALAVDSFTTDAEAAEPKGTVHANGVRDLVTIRVTCYTNCGGSTCDYTGSPCVYC